MRRSSGQPLLFVRQRQLMIVCDESHTLRNPQTLVSEGVRQTRTRNKNFLTATPIVNHCRELGGLLRQIWNPLWALHEMGVGFLECYRDDFNPWAFEHTEDMNTKVVNLTPPDDVEHLKSYLEYQTALEQRQGVATRSRQLSRLQ
jgi:SNF2 domain-containing protein